MYSSLRVRIPVFLPVVLFLFHFDAYSQCGTPPVSGTVTVSSSTTVNSYYPGTGNLSAGAFSLTIGSLDARGNATGIASGDLIVIMQMQGADLNTNNSSSYGDGINGGAASGALNDPNMMAGYYEYATVTSVSGGTVYLMYGLARSYYTRAFTSSNAIRTFQVIRVPRYYDLVINAGVTITAPAWNGSTGGVVVLDAANKITLNGSLNASALGFRGGGGKKLTGAGSGNSNGSGTLTNTDYRWNSPITNSKNTTGGAKGEGVAGTPAYTYSEGSSSTTTQSVEGYINGSMGRSAPANGGGGGTDGLPVGTNNNEYNSGGGGGANGGAGGRGGSGWHGGSGDVTSYPTGGYGGSAYVKNSLQQIIMGGGGGSGTANNSTSSNEVNCSGGQGGGIILVRAGVYGGTGSASANGGDGPGLTTVYSPNQTDAAGGGGAGGTIVLVTTKPGATGLGGITASAAGGNGGDVTTYYDHGPGGGGGGGRIYSNGALASTNITGGTHGLTRSGSSSGSINNAYGSTSGANGVTVTLSSVPLLTNAYGLSDLCGVLPISPKNTSPVPSQDPAADKLLIYPNPATSSTTLQFDAKVRQMVTLQVFNHSGKVVISRKQLAVKGSNYFILPEVRNLGKGVYLVQLNADAKIITGKLMVLNN